MSVRLCNGLVNCLGLGNPSRYYICHTPWTPDQNPQSSAWHQTDVKYSAWHEKTRKCHQVPKAQPTLKIPEGSEPKFLLGKWIGVCPILLHRLIGTVLHLYSNHPECQLNWLQKKSTSYCREQKIRLGCIPEQIQSIFQKRVKMSRSRLIILIDITRWLCSFDEKNEEWGELLMTWDSPKMAKRF